MSDTNKPLILDTDGIYSQLPDGAIINTGGTSNLTFTVGGRGLLFDDGSSSAGGGSTLTLQAIYNNTPPSNGTAGIFLTLGKDFVISDIANDGHFLRIDALTGKVTITGDLEVQGTSSTIDTVIQDSDHWQISPKLGTTTALKIEPDFGVIPVVDLVSVRRTYGTAPVFRIDSSGNLFATQNLTVGGLINGVDIAELRSEMTAHENGTAFRHPASDIDITPITTLPGAVNVQQALEAINVKADMGGAGGTVRGYAYTQLVVDTIWTVVHHLNSVNINTTIYDTNQEVIIPEKIKIIDSNTILISFLMPISGKAMILAF
jgi:hypothetical protein